MASTIAKLWNEKHAGCTAETRTVAKVYRNYSVEIWPDGEKNTGDAFHHTEELAAISSAFKLNSYCSIEHDEHRGAFIVAYIF